MAYTQVISVYLGASNAGKTLNIQLKDTANANAVGATLLAQYERGTDGTYHLVVEIPDDHRGWVDVRESTTVLTSVGINPEEVVNSSLVNAIAEKVLTLDWTTISSWGARSALQALRHIRNKWTILGTAKTVYQEDDTTVAWTSTVSADGAALPVTGDEPA